MEVDGKWCEVLWRREKERRGKENGKGNKFSQEQQGRIETLGASSTFPRCYDHEHHTSNKQRAQAN